MYKLKNMKPEFEEILFIAVLLTIAKTGKQQKYLLMHEYIKEAYMHICSKGGSFILKLVGCSEKVINWFIHD